MEFDTGHRADNEEGAEIIENGDGTFICVVTSPIHGVMRVRVEARGTYDFSATLLDGKSAGYGFSSGRAVYRKRGIFGFLRSIGFLRSRTAYRKRSVFGFTSKRKAEITPNDRMEIYNAVKEFVEQLGPSGYLDDGP
jgi:hypothetical protein